MKLTGQHLSNLRGIINQYSRTQESYTDQFLYEVLCVARAEILRQQLVKFNHISEENLLRFCIELELVKAHDCNCVPAEIDCLVLRTKYKLPTALTSRNHSKIWASTLDGRQIAIVTDQEWLMYSTENTFGELFGSIINGYLYLWNLHKKIKVLQVSGYWSDLMALQNIPNCDPNNPQNTCFDPLVQPFPLQEEYAHATYLKAFQLLNIPLQVPQDLTNDSNPIIKI